VTAQQTGFPFVDPGQRRRDAEHDRIVPRGVAGIDPFGVAIEQVRFA